MFHLERADTSDFEGHFTVMFSVPNSSGLFIVIWSHVNAYFINLRNITR